MVEKSKTIEVSGLIFRATWNNRSIMESRRFPCGLLTLLSLTPMKLPAVEQSRPNILWLIVEDFRQHLGCYGAKEVSSPNLDALAKNGVRYTRFFTTAPVCSPDPP